MPNQVSALTTNLISSAKPESKAYEIRDTKYKGLVLRVQPSGYKSLNYEYRINGRKKRTSLGSAAMLTLGQARAMAIKVHNSANAGVDVNQQARIARASTLGSFINGAYTEYGKGRIISFDNIIARLNRNFGNLYDMPIGEISVTDLMRWRAGKKVKFQTIKRELAYLKTIINLAIKNRVIETHPICNFQFEPTEDDTAQIAEEQQRDLSPDEEKRLRHALSVREDTIRSSRTSANAWRTARSQDLLPVVPTDHYVDHVQPIVLLALLTGLRRGDIFDLKWQHVDLDRRLITKQINKTRRKKPQATALPVCSEVIEILRKCRKSSTNTDLVFPSPVTGKRYDNITKAFKAVLETAQIENFRFHDLRHTFGTRLSIGGIELNTIKGLMTHSDIKMTQRYAHLSPDHMRDSLDRVFG